MGDDQEDEIQTAAMLRPETPDPSRHDIETDDEVSNVSVSPASTKVQRTRAAPRMLQQTLTSMFGISCVHSTVVTATATPTSTKPRPRGRPLRDFTNRTAATANATATATKPRPPGRPRKDLNSSPLEKPKQKRKDELNRLRDLIRENRQFTSEKIDNISWWQQKRLHTVLNEIHKKKNAVQAETSSNTPNGPVNETFDNTLNRPVNVKRGTRTRARARASSKESSSVYRIPESEDGNFLFSDSETACTDANNTAKSKTDSRAPKDVLGANTSPPPTAISDDEYFNPEVEEDADSMEFVYDNLVDGDVFGLGDHFDKSSPIQDDTPKETPFQVAEKFAIQAIGWFDQWIRENLPVPELASLVYASMHWPGFENCDKEVYKRSFADQRQYFLERFSICPEEPCAERHRLSRRDVSSLFPLLGLYQSPSNQVRKRKGKSKKEREHMDHVREHAWLPQDLLDLLLEHEPAAEGSYYLSTVDSLLLFHDPHEEKSAVEVMEDAINGEDPLHLVEKLQRLPANLQRLVTIVNPSGAHWAVVEIILSGKEGPSIYLYNSMLNIGEQVGPLWQFVKKLPQVLAIAAKVKGSPFSPNIDWHSIEPMHGICPQQAEENIDCGPISVYVAVMRLNDQNLMLTSGDDRQRKKFGLSLREYMAQRLFGYFIAKSQRLRPTLFDLFSALEHASNGIQDMGRQRQQQQDISADEVTEALQATQLSTYPTNKRARFDLANGDLDGPSPKRACTYSFSNAFGIAHNSHDHSNMMRRIEHVETNAGTITVKHTTLHYGNYSNTWTFPTNWSKEERRLQSILIRNAIQEVRASGGSVQVQSLTDQGTWEFPFGYS
jgi:hypothetical protein